MTLLSAVITGPQGTPYSNGCFIFDVHFPSVFLFFNFRRDFMNTLFCCRPNYPQVPPTVNSRTNGGGKVRFNPNLYKLVHIFRNLSKFSKQYICFAVAAKCVSHCWARGAVNRANRGMRKRQRCYRLVHCLTSSSAQNHICTGACINTIVDSNRRSIFQRTWF
jgi:hypothetical protein